MDKLFPDEPCSVAILMGSNSDWAIMHLTADLLDQFAVPYFTRIVSAHRTPERLFAFAQQAHRHGVQVIIAGAGGAAHLPGMIAALSPLPVIGVPIKSSNSIDGWDSVLSILQMPTGVPVATVALNGSTNAAILATQILSISQPKFRQQIIAYKQQLANKVELNPT